MPKTPPQISPSEIACIVLAGGQGSRLFPLTQARCKPAVSFGGRYRLIDIPLSHALNARIQRVYVISQYLASGLHQHILETYQLDLFHNTKIHLLSPEETLHQKVWYKGTADAVRQNLNHFLPLSADYFLILSGDQLYNMDLHEMIQFAKQSDADLVIAALPVEEKEAKRMGILKINSDQTVSDFIEKPATTDILNQFVLDPSFLSHHQNKNLPYYLGSMGIYIFKREALLHLLQESGDDFGKDLIPHQVKHGKTTAFVYKGYWEDIGTISSYYQANLALITQKNCLDTYDEKNPIFTHPQHLPCPLIKGTLINHALISQGTLIEAHEISNSIIGFRIHIKTGSIIRNSIVLGNHSHNNANNFQFFIGERCHIENAIIDEQVCIGNRVQLINKHHVKTGDYNGIFIRDGIIIIPSGTSLPDDFVLTP